MGRGQRGVRAGSFSAALSHPDFRRLALGLAVSTAGNWLYNVALLVYVFDRTHSASWVAAATVVRLAPFVLFGPIGGALADRLERRSLMIASDLARGGLMLGLAVAAATSAPPAVALAIAFLSTTAGTPYNPAVGAMTPALVREADLAAANAVVRTIDNTAIVLGPAIGGLLLVVGPPAFTFLANGVSFLGSVIAVSLISVRSRAETVGERPGLGTTVVEGVRALRGGRSVSVLPWFMMGASFIYGAETVLLVLVSERLLGTGSNGLGYLFSAIGLGAVLAAGLSTRLVESSWPQLALAGALVAMGVPLALLTVVHQAWVAFVILLVQGAGIVVVDVLVLTLLQRSLRPALIGRVLGVMSSLEVGSTLVGSLLAPLLVSTVNLRAALVVLGLGPAVIALIALPRLRGLARNADRRRRALAPTVELLAGLGVFAGVDRPSLELLAASSVSEHAVAGTTVVREGAPASDFYVVRSGTLDVVSSGEGGTAPVMVNTLGGGDHFGEIGLIEAIPRTASVVARTDSELIRVSGGDLLDVLNRSPAMASTLFDGVAGRLARTHPSYRPGRRVQEAVT